MAIHDQEEPFPNTRWTLVNRAANPSAAGTETALEELLKRYLPALKAHLINARRLPYDHVEDLLQGFVTDKILMGDLLARANKEKGKFRTFLLTSLERYVISVFRKENALRRSPGHGLLLSIDAASGSMEDAVIIAPATTSFDLVWIREIIRETLRRIEINCAMTGRTRYWELFEDRVVNPALHGSTPESYAHLVCRLGFVSPVQASNALLTVKRLFERTFRAVVQEYAGNNDQDINQEIDELRAIIAEANAYQ